MINDNPLKNACVSPSKLREYLSQKGQSHTHYRFYSRANVICSILDNGYLCLTDGQTWNDTTDRKDFNSKQRRKKNFGICLSYSGEESVAMWMLYGGVKNDSAMIDFTPKAIRSILDISSIEVGVMEGKTRVKVKKFVPKMKLLRNDFEVNITDILYISKREDFVKRSDEKARIDSVKKIKGRGIYVKQYPWEYENECRLIISIDKSKLSDQSMSTVGINLESIDWISSLDRIYKGPNSCRNQSIFRPSTLTGKVDWNLK